MLLAKLYWRPTLSCALSPKGRQPREGGGPIDLEGSLHEGEAHSPGDEADVAADRAGAAQANSSSPPALDGLQGRKEDNKPLARRLIALFESVLEPVANRMNLQLAKRLGHFKSSVTGVLCHSSRFILFDTGCRNLSKSVVSILCQRLVVLLAAWQAIDNVF